MKPLPELAPIRWLALVTGALTVHGQMAWDVGGMGGAATSVFAFPVNQAIPDGDLSGLANTQTLPASSAPIRSVAVTLVLTPLGEGGFTGDLYATLAHDGGGYSVLLNRPGKHPGRPFGYSDDVAVNVTLADDAEADIHHYRLTLTGSEVLPLTSALTGRWQPDGRPVDPLLVTASDLRDATLASFTGVNQAGNWTLFVADVSGGGEYQLDSWSLAVTVIPEPGGVLGALALGALGWVMLQRRRERRRPPLRAPTPR
ncbi:MAG: PEP-CTERM sorting domain-containing protein [Verrucomicrobiales bacterium]|nr:PEP-CTERM sorting domain-containing protein [Verrucomicrobiales bacterium]